MFWQTNACYEFGPFRINARERLLLRAGEVVPLTPKVFDILLVLVQNSEHLLSKDEVMKLVWPDTVVEEGNIARNISTLRKALGEAPGQPQFIETIPWRGYRFVANVTRVEDQLVVSTRAAPSAIDSIAVLPFVNVGGANDFEYVAEGLSEAVIRSLAQVTQLRVMSRNSTFRYKNRSPEASVVGRELNVRAVLFGRVTASDDLLSISVELADARDDSHIWGAQYLRQRADLFTIQQKIAREIADKLRLKLNGEEQHRLARPQTEDAEAYQCYLKGRYHFHKLTVDGVQKGVENFQQALAKDPNYALAYVGLGDCYNYWGKPAEAKQAMTKALDLDETLGEAHASLGFFRFIYDWDFAGAETELTRALELSPNYAEAHHWAAIYFANIGRRDDARRAAAKAVELDPLSLLMNMTPALASYLERDHDRAIEQLLKLIEMEANFPAAHSVLGNAYLQKGSYEAAMSEYEKVLGLSQGVAVVERAMKAVIAHAQAKVGKRSEAENLLAELIAESDEETPSAHRVSPHAIAEIYVALGDKEQAFAWLNRALNDHDPQMVSLRVNPTLDDLRSDPRFADLVRRVGL
jgi:TolB-like protein/Tfp pilus assembly protein PilF